MSSSPNPPEPSDGCPAYSRAAEWSRWVMLLVAALALTFPFLTSRAIGGTDARWYLYMLMDALDQMRAGHFPALIGQGPYAWNGGVHPFRSAPVYLWLGELWNAVTWGRLSPVLVQHLTVVTSAVAGTWGFYAAATALAPRRRWEAFLAAVIYLEVPAWLGVVVWADAYMSYMAFGALPLLLYGNARCALSADGRGYFALSAGLALLWMCHPPIAALGSFATLLIQGGLILRPEPFPWRRAVQGAGLFALLAAYYLASMSEIPSRPDVGGAGRAVLQVAGVALGMIGSGACLLKGRGWRWAFVGAIGVALLTATSWPLLLWVGATALLVAVAAIVGRSTGWFDPERACPEILWLGMLAGAAVAEFALGPDQPDANGPGLAGLAFNASHAPGYWAPETLGLPREGNFQLGWAVGLGLVVMAATYFGRRPLAVKLFFAGASTLFLGVLRVPAVSDFLVAYFPDYFSYMTGFPLVLRVFPVVAAFTVLAGFLWLAGAPGGGERHARRRWILAGVTGLAVWGGYQATFLMRWTVRQMSTAETTATNLRPENAVLDRYAYDLLHLPSYFSNDKMDPLIESRLRDPMGRVLFDPDEAARMSEAGGSTRIRLVASPVPGGLGRWLEIEPRLTLQPAEHLLLRFEFNPAKDYAGFLILVSEDGYREYRLPSSGMGINQAFGVGPDHSKVVSMWNTGSVPERYRWTFAKQAGNTFNRQGEWFGDLVVSKFDPTRLPVRVVSLIPYRAVVTAKTDAILETFRAFLPGYRATVDGRPVPVSRSAQSQVAVSVPAGTHTVELRYVGTSRLHLAALVSGVAWLGWAWLGWRGRRAGASMPRRSPWAWLRRRRGQAAAGAALLAVLAAEFLVFDRQTSRHETWVYPRWNDQIQYLTEAYTGYQFAQGHGFLAGLWETLLKPSAQGVGYDTFALTAFAAAGVSRSAALAINGLAWVALQAAFYAATVRQWRSRSLGWATIGLWLCWATPLSAGPGSAIDFRLDFLAACAFGVALAATIQTDGFRSTGRSVWAGAAMGLTLLLRFLTGTYFVVILLGLLVWVVAGAGRLRRCLNLLLATAIAIALAAPEFWRNRVWVWNYYVIGHFTGPESAIRNPHFGLGRSLEFIGSSLVGDHLGAVFGWCVLWLALGTGGIWLAARQRAAKTGATGEPTRSPASWWVPAWLYTGAPFLVLTLHSQKSPIVLSILVPGVVALLVGGGAGLARLGAPSRRGWAAKGWPAGAAAGALLLGAWHFVSVQEHDPHGVEFTRDARKVNDLADFIFASSRSAGLATPRVAVDQITDSLDAQVLRVICYERHRVWVPFVMTLPTGIMRERPEIMLERLAQSDYVFIATAGGAGGFPYDEEMRTLRPQTEAWCRAHLHRVDRFPLGGRTWELYVRAGLEGRKRP